MARNDPVNPKPTGAVAPLVPAETRDARALAQENELLRYEVTHLRGRLAAAEKQARRLAKEIAAKADSPATSSAPGQQRSGDARDDLVRLLRKLDRSPAGPLMRTRKGFRALRDKYLGKEGE